MFAPSTTPSWPIRASRGRRESLARRRGGTPVIDAGGLGGHHRAPVGGAGQGAGAVDAVRLHHPGATPSGEVGVAVALSVPEPASSSVSRSPRAVEVGQRGQDQLQLLDQVARIQQAAAQFVQAMQVGHLLAELGLGAAQQVVDLAALGDVDARLAQAHGALAGPDDVDAQHEPVPCRRPCSRISRFVVPASARRRWRTSSARLRTTSGRRDHVGDGHRAAADVHAGQLRERGRQVDRLRRQVQVEDTDRILAGQHQALLGRGTRGRSSRAGARPASPAARPARRRPAARPGRPCPPPRAGLADVATPRR